MDKPKYCGKCKYHKYHWFYLPDYEDEIRIRIFCSCLNKVVHKEMMWYDCSAVCFSKKDNDFLDTPPDNCPLNKI